MGLVDVYAVRDEYGNPALGDCMLIVADGTVKIEFRNGHAQVEDVIARQISHRSDLNIPALGAGVAPVGDPTPAETPDIGFSDTETVPKSVEVQRELDRRREESIQAAREHLAADGEEVPDTVGPVLEVEKAGTAQEVKPPVLQPGFVAMTDDGEPRCLAAKADGSQCSNPAQGGHACGLAKHREALGVQG